MQIAKAVRIPSRRAASLWTATLTAVAMLVACQGNKAKLVVPMVKPRFGVELGESQLSTILVCTDSLGLDATRFRGGRCVPCIPMGTITGSRDPLQHARTMWTH